jgi:hypothetical protein
MASSARYLRLTTTLIATLFIGFGINIFLNPTSALSFFELEYPSISTHKQVIDGTYPLTLRLQNLRSYLSTSYTTALLLTHIPCTA